MRHVFEIMIFLIALCFTTYKARTPIPMPKFYSRKYKTANHRKWLEGIPDLLRKTPKKWEVPSHRKANQPYKDVKASSEVQEVWGAELVPPWTRSDMNLGV